MWKNSQVFCESTPSTHTNAPSTSILVDGGWSSENDDWCIWWIWFDIYVLYWSEIISVGYFLFFLNLWFHKILANFFTILSYQQRILSKTKSSLKQGLESNVWFIKNRTMHKLSLWLYFDFLAIPHFILQISHAKTFKMKHTRCPYNNIIQKYS